MSAGRAWDVVIVGAGTVGTFHALAAGRAGLRTLLIERSEWPRGASVRNFGMIIPSGIAGGPWREHALASAAIYDGLAREIPLPDLQRGMQYVASTDLEADVLRELAAIGPAHGAPGEWLDARQSLDYNPALNPAELRSSLVFADDLLVDSRRLFRRMIPWLGDRFDVVYRPSTRVVQIVPDGDGATVVTASADRIAAGHVFVCSGAELHDLYPGLVAARGVSFCKLQMMRTEPQSRVRLRGALASGWSIRRYDAFAPAPSHAALRAAPAPPEIDRFGIHVLARQLPDSAIVLGDSHQTPPDEAARSDELDMAIDRAIVDQAKRLLRLDSWEIASRWHGVYPTHPTDDALIERVAPGVEVVIIFGGKGMTCAPALGAERVAAAFGMSAE
jgi:FAD dependent oxidoreductase TIGR03364